GAVDQRPADVLGIGELQPICAQLLGQRDGVGDMIDVVARKDDVQGQRQGQLLDPAGDLELSVERLPAGDTVRSFRAHVLDRKLEVVQAGRAKADQSLAAERNAARDEVRVEVELAGRLDQLLQVVAKERLAPGKVELDHAQLLGFHQHAFPGCGGKLGRMRREADRIGAVGAVKRAAIGKLGHQRVGPVVVHGSIRTSARSTIWPRNSITSRSISAGGAAYLRASWSMMAPTVFSPVQSRQMSAAVGSSRSPRSG